jgi:hypothetical protein
VPPEAEPAAPAVPIPELPRNIPGLDLEKLQRQLQREIPGMTATSTVLDQVRQLEALAQWGEEQKLLEQHVAKHPDDLGAQLQLAAVRRRTGQRARGDAAILELAKSLEGDGWMNALVRAWAGLIPEDQAIAAAHAPHVQATKRQRLTQTYYYLGLAHETADPPDFKAAARDYGKALSEGGAGAELELAGIALGRVENDSADEE